MSLALFQNSFLEELEDPWTNELFFKSVIDFIDWSISGLADPPQGDQAGCPDDEMVSQVSTLLC